MHPNNYLITLLTALLVFTGNVASAQEIQLEDELILSLPFQGNAQDQSGQNISTSVEGPVLTEDRSGIRVALIFSMAWTTASA